MQTRIAIDVHIIQKVDSERKFVKDIKKYRWSSFCRNA